jgi:dihydroorotate dehydrogenase (fumarate)
LKSLFEEQVRMDAASLNQSLAAAENWHSEVFALMEANIGMRYGTREYLQVVRDCKAAVDIPVIASINCVSTEWWQDFASEVAAAGADALELNIAIMPRTLTTTGAEIEDRCVEIVRVARKAVRIPVAVKLGPYFTSLPQIVLRLREAGADGFVLFNRFYRPTLDIETMTLTAADPYSTPAELAPSLRWICLLAERVSADLAAATGVHTHADVIRSVLVGANAVQIVSALYTRGLDHLRLLLDGVESWMSGEGYETVAGFRGLACQARHPDCDMFNRCQYIKGLVGLE